MADETRVPSPEEIAAKVARDEAEARKLTAEAAKWEADAALREMEREKAERQRDEELASNKYNHVYRFASTVSATSVADCIAQLDVWHRLNPACDIRIVFTSPGGDVIDGFALFDHIRQIQAAGHKITTVALGEAASMAGILMMVGDHRVMGREAWLLIHRASFGAIGSTYQIEDKVEFVKRIEKRIINIFVSRSKLTAAKIKRNWERKDWWLSSDECLELELVDEVV